TMSRRAGSRTWATSTSMASWKNPTGAIFGAGLVQALWLCLRRAFVPILAIAILLIRRGFGLPIRGRPLPLSPPPIGLLGNACIYLSDNFLSDLEQSYRYFFILKETPDETRPLGSGQSLSYLCLELF